MSTSIVAPPQQQVSLRHHLLSQQVILERNPAASADGRWTDAWVPRWQIAQCFYTSRTELAEDPERHDIFKVADPPVRGVVEFL